MAKLIKWDILGSDAPFEASNGVEAYKIAIEENVDVVITDIKMPLMDGSELCKQLKEVMSDVTIILLSAYEDFTTAQIALRYNVKEYILKPIDISKIEFLSKLLMDIKDSRNSKSYLNMILQSKDIDKDILYYLKGNESQYFIDFFAKMEACSVTEYAAFSAVCVKLISLLYDYLLEIGVNIDSINKKKLALENELMQFKTRQDTLDYTRKLYFDVLQFDNHSERNFHAVLAGKIMDDIHENYPDASYSVAAIAKKYAFSPDYIGKIFKNITDTTIVSYIAQMRMKKALELLKNTEIPINDIAKIVGYANSNYFAKVFRAKHNMTPSRYRTKFKSETR